MYRTTIGAGRRESTNSHSSCNDSSITVQPWQQDIKACGLIMLELVLFSYMDKDERDFTWKESIDRITNVFQDDFNGLK